MIHRCLRSLFCRHRWIWLRSPEGRLFGMSCDGCRLTFLPPRREPYR